MIILVTGANGFLGQHLCKWLADNGFQVIALSRGLQNCPVHKNIYYRSVELTDVSKLNEVFDQFNISQIIHTAAMSKPDECEANKSLCIEHNVGVTENLVSIANKKGILFHYISTDFIFGENGPHAEEAIPEPLNFYGESKLQAEMIVKAQLQNYSIVRPVFIYGKLLNNMRPSFPHWVRSNLMAGKAIKVVSDQFRTPTFVTDICKGIHRIINQKKLGIFHLAGKDILSPFQMAITTARILGLDKDLIEQVTADSFPETVRRSKRSGLTIERARSVLGYEPVTFEQGIEMTFGISPNLT